MNKIRSQLDDFIPKPDICERFSTVIRAPANDVFRVASDFDMQSPIIVRIILWLRAKMLGSKPRNRPANRMIEEMRQLGWGCLRELPDELFVAGAVCQPWDADVVFTPLPPDGFLDFAEPGKVKIAWTLEADAIGACETHFSTETRAVATDEVARIRFLKYWRWARFGIITIRLVMLPAIKRAAEREWRRQLHAENKALH